MALWHTVVQGETVSSIADDHKFRDYNTVYKHPNNIALRGKRPDPDIIFPGDKVYVPDFDPGSFSGATDQRHVFVVRSRTKILRIRLQDSDGKPFIRADYELRFGSTALTGTTDGNGVLEKPVPIQQRQATLNIGVYEWTLNIGELNPIDKTPDAGATGIQQRLRNLGFHPGAIDGVLGPKTKAAIQELQKKHPPLAVNGVPNPETIQRLISEHGS